MSKNKKKNDSKVTVPPAAEKTTVAISPLCDKCVNYHMIVYLEGGIKRATVNCTITNIKLIELYKRGGAVLECNKFDIIKEKV